jgi:hypothetical protein
VPDPDPHLGALVLAGEHAPLSLPERLQVIVVDELRAEGVGADRGLGASPEDPLGRRAHRADAALGVQDGDDVRGGVDDRLEGGLPLPHRLVGLPALGHVHDVAEGVDQHALVVIDEPGHAQQPAVAVLEQEAVLLLQLRGPLGDGPLERLG